MALNVHRYNASITERTHAAFYYLEKTEKTDDVLLVHRRNINRPRPSDMVTRRPGDPRSRKLMSQLPVGYRFNGSIYLFDSRLGCVYMIGDFGQLGPEYVRDPPKDQYRARKNIPYERFFRCGDEFVLANNFALRHPANRCETRYVNMKKIGTERTMEQKRI